MDENQERATEEQTAENEQPAEKKERLGWLRRFFFPPEGTPWTRRLAPYALLGILTFIFLTAGTYVWDYTNSPAFCGTTCHTMPPEYAAYQVSPHARVDCVDCHVGDGFVAQRITRKAGEIRHVTSLMFTQYEFPIRVKHMRPARETCERCHYPAKFSDDSLRENINFLNDEENTRESIYLALRTGGGTRREGLGRGIHWHIENEVWYVPTDRLEQNIPYVRTVAVDGTETEYMALDSDITMAEAAGMEQERMDCITCHNRISHNILPPEESVDQALERNQINADIPYIRYLSVQMLQGEYGTDEAAIASIRALDEYYAEEFPEAYGTYQTDIDEAVEVLVRIYQDSVFREQKIDWSTHPNNLGHKDWPGCFRCHDGQHVSSDGEAIRLECNLCHSIPEVVEEGTIEPVLPLATGLQPDSHFSTHWINRHRYEFDQTCQACHTVGNPGGTDDSSFCSNSACHGTAWEYADLDAPGLADIVAVNDPEPPAEAVEVGPGGPTYDGVIGQFLEQRCTSCHNSSIATGQLVLETYEGTMRGGASGPVVLPGDADDSPLITRQLDGHFGQFTDDEMEIVRAWIRNGAPQN